MPKIDDILEKREKKFKKKSYRAWDFSGAIVDSLEQDANNVTNSQSRTEVSVMPGTLTDIDPEKIKKEGNDGVINNARPALPDFKKDRVKLLDIKPKNVQLDVGIVGIKDEKVKSNLNKTGTRGRKSLATIQQEKVIKSLPSIHQKIICLKGAQQKVFEYIVNICHQNGELATGPIYSTKLLSIAECTYEVMKMAIKRLIGKNLIQRDLAWAQKGPGSALHFTLTSEEAKEIAIDYFKITSVI